jgi:hypothetical protein
MKSFLCFTAITITIADALSYGSPFETTDELVPEKHEENMLGYEHRSEP